MKQIYFLALLGFIFFSCSESDDPKPSANIKSKIIGDYRFYFIDADHKVSAKGKIIEKPIKVLIKNKDGNFVRLPLSIELNDPSGSIFYNNYYNSDTISFTWVLGCNLGNQKLKITANNICGISKDHCIDVEALTVTADASGAPSGWYELCYPNNNHLYNIAVDDELVVVRGEDLYIKDDLLEDWRLIPIQGNSYSHNEQYKILSNGDLLCSINGSFKIIFKGESYFTHVNMPFSYYQDFDVDITNSGEYFLISEGSQLLYHSTDGINWEVYVNLYDLNNYSYGRPLNIAVVGNQLYIITSSSSIIKIDTETNAHHVYHYNNLMEYTPYMENITMEVLNNKIFLTHSNYFSILDLQSNDVISYERGVSTVSKSNNTIYINNKINFWKWEGNEVRLIEYPSQPEYYSNLYPFKVGFHKGNPIILKENHSVLVYQP